MLSRLLQQVSPVKQARRWVVAYSGGLDSHALLHALVQVKSQNSQFPDIVALHVNHQLQSESSAWEGHCNHVATSLGVGFHAYQVDVSQKGSLEAQARSARYAAFDDFLKQGDVLMMAHHQGDQVETFLYRLLRGAGVKGLSGIPSKRIFGKATLLRPLLTCSKDKLEVYAKDNALQWIDDPSNQDDSYDRNYLRLHALPILYSRWPTLAVSVQRAIKHLMESQQVLNEVAEEDLALMKGDDGEPWIDIEVLLKLSKGRKRNVLRYWLNEHHIKISDKQLYVLLNEVITADNDSKAEIQLDKNIIRRYKQKLYITDLSYRESFETFSWNGVGSCHVNGYGDIKLKTPEDIEFIIRPRQGGELVRISGYDHDKKLKGLLQALEIPRWRRNNIPLIYVGEELVAVGEIIRCEIANDILGENKIVRV